MNSVLKAVLAGGMWYGGYPKKLAPEPSIRTEQVLMG